MRRAARMNGVAVFAGLLFWGWIWGAWGMFLAVPMMVVIKAISDRIDELNPVGELLGKRPVLPFSPNAIDEAIRQRSSVAGGSSDDPFDPQGPLLEKRTYRLPPTFPLIRTRPSRRPTRRLSK